ncbi:uncharacterized protein LOC110716970 [Chenopodium quinoa]|uniref:uncharacterized protein LOC110716970 n=1 Tax=Chenopodium quinoa TaxID=63459 RepID=UPI000B76F339|nr:uncharacterized protein LOC110716970 [Chenopodium quinoa]
MNSVSYLIRALKIFGRVSRLEANVEKTAIFFGNVRDRVVKEDILNCSGFINGSAPSKYLGIPLNSRHLRLANFDVLMDKMLHKLTCWSSRNLSYAVRVTLLCRGFIWEGSSILSKAPPLAWSWVCSPKKMGGLGVRDYENWNMAALGNRQCIASISSWLQIIEQAFNIDTSWKDWKKAVKDPIKRRVCFTGLAAVVYYIWWARNSALWNKAVPIPNLVCRKIGAEVIDRCHQMVSKKWRQQQCKWLYDDLRKNCPL